MGKKRRPTQKKAEPAAAAGGTEQQIEEVMEELQKVAIEETVKETPSAQGGVEPMAGPSRARQPSAGDAPGPGAEPVKVQEKVEVAKEVAKEVDKEVPQSSGRSAVARPSHGRDHPGLYKKTFSLVSNLYPIKFKAETQYVYHYDVEIFEVRDGPNHERRQRKVDRDVSLRVLDRLVQTNNKKGQLFFSEDRNEPMKPVFDNSVKNMYTVEPLGIIGTSRGDTAEESVNIEVDNCAAELKFYKFTVGPEQKRMTFDVVIKVPGDGKNGNIGKCEIDLGEDHNIPEEAIAALNVVFKHGSAIRRKPVGQNSLYPRLPLGKNRDNIGKANELGFGHFQSVRSVEAGLALVVNRTATVFHPSGSVFDYIANLMRVNLNAIDPPFLGRNRVEIDAALRKLHFEAYHYGYRKVFKKFVGFTSKSARDQTFGEEQVQTVAKYFATQYPDQPLEFPDFPCMDFVMGPRDSERHNFLPIELCFLVPDQSLRGRPDKIPTQNMIKQTAVPPKQRFQQNDQIVKEIKAEAKPFTDEFGLELITTPLKTIGGLLKSPELLYGGGQKYTPVNGKWDMIRKKVYKSITLTKWVVVAFNPRGKQDIDNFINALISKGREMGVTISNPLAVLPFGTYTGRNDVLSMYQKVIPNPLNKPQLIVCVTDKNDQMYAEMKQIGETCGAKYGVLSQYVDTKNANTSPQTVANIILKINAKLGGINQILSQKPKSLDSKTGNTMIIGADVTHPGPGDKADVAVSSDSVRVEVSVSSLVASLDSDYFDYYTAVRVQEKDKQEMISKLGEMIKECIKSYYVKNKNCLPQHIIYFRDGVSDGQFKTVLDIEINELEKACRDIAVLTKKPFKPKITLVVVQKRHQRRIRPEFDADGVGRHGNVPPGTCTDEVIVHPRDFDFYLCSHEGIQGTSKPAHYFVLRDDYGYGPDELFPVIFYLTHTYAKCTRSISIPAPTMYAHLAAERARAYIVGNPALRFPDIVIPRDASKETVKALIDTEKARRVVILNEAIQVVPELRKQLYYC